MDSGFIVRPRIIIISQVCAECGNTMATGVEVGHLIHMEAIFVTAASVSRVPSNLNMNGLEMV